MAAHAKQEFCSTSVVSDKSSGLMPFTLLQKWQKSPDSWLLRFALPDDQLLLAEDAPTIPTCISVHYNGTTELGDHSVLKKSYSPISHPSTEETMDLLVKAYAPRPGGGVGAYLCDMGPGEILQAVLKSKRMMHGSPGVLHRWDHLGLVAGGTGVAPLFQIVQILLQDPTDTTRIQLLSINKKEDDLLMREEMDQLAKDYPDRFSVQYSLTEPPDDWKGLTGRGSVEMVRDTLPSPSSHGTASHNKNPTMILVCGRDDFVYTWSGPVVRAPPKADGTKGPKIQGPLLGILQDSGFDESEVFKY
jgi:cytochrome-b5 reductase